MTKTTLLACALSCATVYSFADQEISFNEKGSPKILVAERNVLVVDTNGASASSQGAVQDIQPMTSPTPSSMARLQNNHCCEPFLTVDYLLWTAREDNLSYCIDANFTGDSTLVTNKVHNPDFEWGSGFRVGAGLNFRHDGWDTYLNYTQFHPDRAKDSASAKGLVTQLVPAFPANVNQEFTKRMFTQASTAWSLEFDAIDWTLGRNFYVSRYLTLRPFAGLKTAWIEQSQHFRFFAPINDKGGNKDEQTFTNTNKQDFWGIGAEIGFDTAWYVYKKNLSIIADLDVSGLWGRYKLHQKQYVTKSTGTDNTVDLRNSYHAIRAVIEWSLGMQWESWLYDEKMKFSFSAAWEEQIWLNQNNFARVTILGYSDDGGDLYLQGLTLRARFDF